MTYIHKLFQSVNVVALLNLNKNQMQLWLGYLFLSSLQIPPLFIEVPLPSRKACDHVFVCWWYLFLRFSYPIVIYFFIFLINRISCQFFFYFACLRSEFCAQCCLCLCIIHTSLYFRFYLTFTLTLLSFLYSLIQSCYSYYS